MLKHAALITVAALAALVPSDAQAWIYMGTPDLGFQINRPGNDLISGSVYVIRVGVEKCNGQGRTSYPVNAWVDPVKGVSVTIDGGDLCTATWYLSSTLAVSGPGFMVQSDTPTLVVNLDPLDTEFAVPGVYVKSGDYWGAAIEVHSFIE